MLWFAIGSGFYMFMAITMAIAIWRSMREDDPIYGRAAKKYAAIVAAIGGGLWPLSLLFFVIVFLVADI